MKGRIKEAFPERLKFLEGKVALITGGGGGIGWGIALEFAREGAQVMIVDIDQKKGEEVLGEVNKISRGHSFWPLDIRKIENFPDFLHEIYRKYGKIDVLVNNAGINTENTFLTMTPENWDLVYETNVRGHFFFSQAIAERMIEAGIGGSILFITSIHQEVVQGRPHYSSSKAGLAMLVKEMAAELAPYNIRVNGIAPGGIYIERRTEDPNSASQEQTVLLGGRNGIPRDIGRAAVFLASDYWSRHITGQILTVSGGQYLKPVIDSRR